MKYIKLFELFNHSTATITKTQWDDKIQDGLGLEKKPTAYHPTKGLKGDVHDDAVEWELSLTNTSTDEKFQLNINCYSESKWSYNVSKNSKSVEEKSFKTLEELISEVNRRFDKNSFIIK